MNSRQHSVLAEVELIKSHEVRIMLVITKPDVMAGVTQQWPVLESWISAFFSPGDP